MKSITTNAVVRTAYGLGVVQGRTEGGWLVRFAAEQVRSFVVGGSLPVGSLYSTLTDETRTVLLVMRENTMEVDHATQRK